MLQVLEAKLVEQAAELQRLQTELDGCEKDLGAAQQRISHLEAGIKNAEQQWQMEMAATVEAAKSAAGKELARLSAEVTAKSAVSDEVARLGAQLAATQALLAYAKEETAEKGNAVAQMSADLETARRLAAQVSHVSRCPYDL